MTTVLSHGPLQTDVPDIRPTLQGSVGTATRVSLVAAGAAAGAGLALVATPSATTALTTAVIGAGLVTSLAANWSTCGMSVAGVVAAPKQVDRKGSSTPVRRLGWHALGSVTTGAVTGALIGALGAAMSGYVPVGWALGVWAVVAVAYGLHESACSPHPVCVRLADRWVPVRRESVRPHGRPATPPSTAPQRRYR